MAHWRLTVSFHASFLATNGADHDYCVFWRHLACSLGYIYLASRAKKT